MRLLEIKSGCGPAVSTLETWLMLETSRAAAGVLQSAMPVLPHVPNRAAYCATFHDETLWRPAVEAIAARHDLAGAALERPADGTNVVYFAGERHVIKLFAPLFGDELCVERDLLAHVSGRLMVTVPELVAEGELEGWPYLVVSRVPGVPLDRIYDSLDARERVRVGAQLGELAAAVRELPPGPLPDRWEATYRELRDGCVERRAAQGLGAECLAALPAKLARLAPAPEARRTFVHADLTGEHVFVDAQRRIVGLIDFADARVADPRYELPAIGVFALRSEREPTRAALRAYGFAAGEVNDALAETLTAFALLHRYGDLRELPGTGARRRPASWEETVAMLLPIA